MYGDRWKQWQPLTDVERSDVLRAEIGYALAQDGIGLKRFRDKYAPKMAGTPDAHAFAVVSAPLGAAGQDFKQIADVAAAADTLDEFLRDMRAHYPDSSPMPSPAVADVAAASVKKPPPPPRIGRPASAAPAVLGLAALGRAAMR